MFRDSRGGRRRAGWLRGIAGDLSRHFFRRFALRFLSGFVSASASGLRSGYTSDPLPLALTVGFPSCVRRCVESRPHQFRDGFPRRTGTLRTRHGNLVAKLSDKPRLRFRLPSCEVLSSRRFQRRFQQTADRKAKRAAEKRSLSHLEDAAAERRRLVVGHWKLRLSTSEIAERVRISVRTVRVRRDRRRASRPALRAVSAVLNYECKRSSTPSASITRVKLGPLGESGARQRARGPLGKPQRGQGTIQTTIWQNH